MGWLDKVRGAVGARAPWWLKELGVHELPKRGPGYGPGGKIVPIRGGRTMASPYWSFDPLAEATDLATGGNTPFYEWGQGTGAMMGSSDDFIGPVGPSGERYGRQFYRRRRMNPLNPRAARRAIRRVVAVRKMLRSIDRHLPKVRVKSKPFGRRR